MADNNGSPYREKISITLTNEILEILEQFGNYHNMSRSACIGYLLSEGLLMEYRKTNGFDFNNEFAFYDEDDGNRVILKRSECNPNRNCEWSFCIGTNKQGKPIISNIEDFLEDEDL